MPLILDLPIQPVQRLVVSFMSRSGLQQQIFVLSRYGESELPVNIVSYTHAFPPSVGGAEKYILLLAEGLVTKEGPGSEITVVTPTRRGNFDDSQFQFRVVREPTLSALVALIAKADIVQLAGPCMLPLFIGWLFRKRVVIEHHGYNAVCPNGQLFEETTKSICPGHFMAQRYRRQCGSNPTRAEAA